MNRLFAIFDLRFTIYASSKRFNFAHVVVQSFFNFGPLGESSMIQPLVFNSSRMASLRLKSFALRAACRASIKAMISAGASTSVAVPMPSTESILSHVANAVAARAGFNEFSARRLLHLAHPTRHDRPRLRDIQIIVQRGGKFAPTGAWIRRSGCACGRLHAACRGIRQSVPAGPGPRPVLRA